MRELAAGDLVDGKYRVGHVLGSGGFATVYAAIDETLGREVALKVLRPDEGDAYDPITRGRFKRELQALGQLRSPHTVRLFDHGTTADDSIYVVFEQVPGRDLAEVLEAEDRLEPQVVEHILRQLLDALGEAHRAGVIHRDIKPDNVRVFEKHGDPWSVKLLDFGIARGTERQAQLTATGELIGTPRYMSPEQLMGKPVDVRSDIYSLGIMVFELLVGQHALHGSRWGEQLDRLQSGYVFTPPESGHRGAALHQIVQRMTAREVNDRPSSAGAVLATLDGIETSDTRVMPQPDSSATSAEMPVASEAEAGVSRSTLGLIAAVLVALVLVFTAVAIVVSVLSSPPEPEVSSRLPRQLTQPVVEPEPNAVVDADAANTMLPEGCSKPVARGLIQLTWMSGLTRYRIRAYVPESYDPEVLHSALAVFHDSRSSADDAIADVREELFGLAESEKIILLFPEGEVTSWARLKQQRKNKPWTAEYRHLAAELLLGTPGELCVDAERIFLVGKGAGGAAVHKLAKETPYGGVAVVGYWPSQLDSQATPDMPYLLLAPNDDGRRRLDGRLSEACGSGVTISYAQRNEELLKKFECEGEPDRSSVTDGECRRWACAVPYQTCIIDGGRRWSGGPAHDDPCETGPTSQFPFGQVIWDFFTSLNKEN